MHAKQGVTRSTCEPAPVVVANPRTRFAVKCGPVANAARVLFCVISWQIHDALVTFVGLFIIFFVNSVIFLVKEGLFWFPYLFSLHGRCSPWICSQCARIGTTTHIEEMLSNWTRGKETNKRIRQENNLISSLL